MHVEDWTTLFLSDIQAIDSSKSCPDGWTNIFKNTWPGIAPSCDCITESDVSSLQTDRIPRPEFEQFKEAIMIDRLEYFAERVHPNQNCSDEQLKQECKDIPGIGPKVQNVILGKKICGKRLGLSWKNIQRPTDTNKQICQKDRWFCQNEAVKSGDVCPTDYRLCEGQVDLQNRVCVRQSQKCPITQFKFFGGA